MQGDIEALLDLVAVEPDVSTGELEERLGVVETLLGDMSTSDLSVPLNHAQRLLTLRDALSGHLLAASTLQILELSASANQVLRRALATTAAGLVDLNERAAPATG